MQEPNEDAEAAAKSNLGSPESTQAGLQQVLQVFITNSANVFLLESPLDAKPSKETNAQYIKLEEQVLYRPLNWIIILFLFVFRLICANEFSTFIATW
jgi:hypothetical protein